MSGKSARSGDSDRSSNSWRTPFDQRTFGVKSYFCRTALIKGEKPADIFNRDIFGYRESVFRGGLKRGGGDTDLLRDLHPLLRIRRLPFRVLRALGVHRRAGKSGAVPVRG